MKNIVYVCENCGAVFPRWQGKCSFCGQWNTLKEIVEDRGKLQKTSIKPEIHTLSDIETTSLNRQTTGLKQFDEVLGGGLVPGAMILLAGEPGIGKSTLALQVAFNVSLKEKKPVLYISGEESLNQIKIRAQRLGSFSDDLKFSNQVEIEAIINAIEQLKPALVVLDSIQTVYTANLPAVPGSVSQVQYCSLLLQETVKKLNVPIIIIGQVTKEGSVAGPKTLEHLVDVVLYFEGEPRSHLRILKNIKNRFGSTFEVGIFEMTNKGFEEVENPSQLFLAGKKDLPGSAVASVIEGGRSFLVEVQALCSKTDFGYPKRTVWGFDLNRLHLLLAVLQKRAGLLFANQDVYLNIVGGLKITEPALDLPICCALASSRLDKTIGNSFTFFGEVGLLGEVRGVSQPDLRIKEAQKVGIKKIIMPNQKTQSYSGIEIYKVNHLKEAFKILFK